MHNPAYSTEPHQCPICEQPTARLDAPPHLEQYGIHFVRKCLGCDPAVYTYFHKQEL